MTERRVDLSALPVKQPLGEFFLASITARQLVEIAYADVRRLVSDKRDFERYLGIQRPISEHRIKQIKKYLQGSDAAFPTAIILAVDENCAEFTQGKGACGVLTLRPYDPEAGDEEEPIPWDRIAKVLDGQHRIAAFMDDNYEYALDDREFDLNLAVFVGADISVQATIFATVNLAQTKVNRSLAYDLTELARTRSPTKSCHNIAVILDKEPRSPLYHRIKRLGTATPGRSKEPLTQAAFVESLVRFISGDPVMDRIKLLDGEGLEEPTEDDLRKWPFRNLFIRKKEIDIAEILFNYFIAVRKKWPNSWDDLATPGNLLPRSNAFKSLMKFLHKDVYPEVAEGDWGRIPKSREFYPYFERLDLRDSDFTTKNFVPGSGGQAMFLKMLRQQIDRDEMLE
jgi:DGQHR domain-containing protein